MGLGGVAPRVRPAGVGKKAPEVIMVGRRIEAGGRHGRNIACKKEYQRAHGKEYGDDG